MARGDGSRPSSPLFRETIISASVQRGVRHRSPCTYVLTNSGEFTRVGRFGTSSPKARASIFSGCLLSWSAQSGAVPWVGWQVPILKLYV